MVDILFPSQIKEMSNFLDEDWVTPESTPFPDFTNPFDTITPATTFPSQTPRTPHDEVFLKPRDSPRTFSHNVQDLIYPGPSYSSAQQGQGLGISGPSNLNVLQTIASPIPEHSRLADVDPVHFRGRSTPVPSYSSSGLVLSTPGPVPIAPNPIGLQQMKQMKRLREEAELSEYGQPRKRKRSTSHAKSTDDLSEEEKLLLELKHDQNLPWKEIAQKFEAILGKTYQVPALQMRYKRLRERMRTWTEDDVLALQKAYEYWEKSQFEIISQKMLEFGAQEKWPAKSCEKKWQELHPEGLTSSQQPRWLEDLTESEYGTPQPNITPTPR